MTKQKTTKRALLMSALSLLLCVSMLVGSTFAWFTDSVTSTGNKIVAGTLEVDLLMGTAVNTYTSIADKDAAIFGANSLLAQNNPADTLWEPGKTQVVYLAVENKGNLDLKYNIALNVTDGGLIGSLEYAIVDGAKYGDITATSWADVKAINGVQTGDVVAGNMVAASNGAIKANEDIEYFALAVHMKEDADNQYQGKDVTVDITVLATQLASESDSFDNQYDANLETSKNGVSRKLSDGSTVFYYNEESGFGDRVRLTALPENLGNEYVVPAEVNDLGGALARADLDKLIIPAGIKYASKSLEGANIDEVIIADGATTVPNRMFYKATVGNVVIPDTVTYLEESAFQQAYLKELVVPANVETFGVHAFASSTIEKITFNGKNLVFDNRPMRGCTNLRTVVFNCDDITFMNTTTNADCWISNKESNGANYSNITFYVKNQTVASKVRAAIIHEKPETTPIYIDEQLFVSVKNVAEFQAALDNAVNNTIISLTADITGNVEFTQKNNVTLTLDGNGKKMDGTIKIVARADTTDAATLTIKNFNFETTTNRSFIHSVETNHYPNNVTITDCTFKGTGANSDVVAITVKSSNNLVIKNCKADSVHSLLQNTSGWNLTVKDCEVTNAGRGMSLGTMQGALIENVKIDASAEKYGIRMKAGYSVTTTIKDCEISAFCPVVVREASVNYNLVIDGDNTMTAANTDGIWCAIGTSEYETNGTMPTAATGHVTVTLNDADLSENGIYGAAAIN